MYQLILADLDPERVRYLAVPQIVYDGILSELIGERMITGVGMRVLVFDPIRREVIEWIS